VCVCVCLYTYVFVHVCVREPHILPNSKWSWRCVLSGGILSLLVHVK